MENHSEKTRAEFDPGEEFIKSGGEIIDSHPDGKPARWKCGKGKNGAPIHPRGMAKDAVSYINEKGEFEGCEPDEKTLEEMKAWRPDWEDLSIPVKKQEEKEKKNRSEGEGD